MSYQWQKGAPKVVFISGGRSGIGREMALRLAGEGAHVAIFNRLPAPDVVKEMKAAAARSSQKFCSHAADVADAATLAAAVAEACAELGAPDLAINSAGINIARPFEELTQAEFERVVTVNLFGSRNFAAAVLPHMTPGSHLVFVASLAAMAGSFAYTAYCASKFGVRGLAEALRIELRLRDIDVSLCCPGEIMTPMVEEELKTMHPISKAIKALGGRNEVGPAVNQMLGGIARRQFEITDGFKPGVTALTARHLPGVLRKTVDRIAARVARSETTDA